MHQDKTKTGWLPPTGLKIALFTALLFVCQATDAICTAAAVASGQAIELNPLMAWLIKCDYWMFFAAKLAIAAGGCILLAYGSARFRWVWTTTKILSIPLLLLVCLHVISFALWGSA